MKNKEQAAICHVGSGEGIPGRGNSCAGFGNEREIIFWAGGRH